MTQATEPDRSGGLGSFQQGILGILTGVVNTVGIPYVAKELNLTSTTDAAGNLRYSAAPTPPTAQERARTLLANPMVLIGGALVLGFVIWKVAK